MSPLSGLVPGLRELRAPLSAGFLWLLALWILFEPSLARAEPTGIVGSLLKLKEELSPVGLVAALTFAAYLAGSLSEAVFSPYFFLMSGRPLGGVSVRTFKAVSSPALASMRLTREGNAALREAVRIRVLELLEPGTGRGLELLDGDRLEGWARAHAGRLSNALLHALQDAREESHSREAHEERVERILCEVLEWSVAEEEEQLRTRLFGDQPELFSKVDRLRAEGEFRKAIGPALVALGVTLAVQGAWWAAFLFTAAAVLLVRQGLKRDAESNAALIEAVRGRKVQSPALEALSALKNPAGVA
jgi:hypothetical protein